MKILQLYNQQRSTFGGEATVIENTTRILEQRGHRVKIAVRSSRGIESSFVKKAKAAVNGLYSFSGASEVKKLIASEHPNVVHVHGIYPQWSPAIFVACRRLGVPTILHVHCHYLTCPNWYHLRDGKVCELCFGGREYWCVLTNCRGSYAESVAYTLRSFMARKLRLVTDNVTVFLAVSEFLKQRLVMSGIPAGQIEVLHNAVPDGEKLANNGTCERGAYIGYCGRLSAEKGVNTLLEAARRTSLPVRIAGDGPERRALERNAPPNVRFLGYLDRIGIERFYDGCRFLVVPSLSFEGFPMSVVEAMATGRPVIGSAIGAIPEIIDHGETGFLFDPGNVQELANRMSALWENPGQCHKLGEAARSRTRMRCSEDLYYSKLMRAYQRALEMS